MKDCGQGNGAGFRMMVTGGGTGGHLFPGIALAEAVQRKLPGSEVLFVGTERLIDQQVLAGRSFQVTAIRSRALKGRGLVGKLLGVLQVPFSIAEAMRLIRGFRPLLVVGVGGYVTGPVVLAARLMGVATAIHEQNSVPGLANRLLGRVVDRVLLSIPASNRYFPANRCVLTGNPVRAELLDRAKASVGAALPPTLLVLGGSQGAHRVNTLVVEALSRVVEELPVGFRVVHQTGAGDEAWVREQYRELGIDAEVAAFFSDMGRLYSEAGLVVSRAGATSLAEMTVFGRPAILIPYPFAADDHQAGNARFLVEGGAALMFREGELDGATLAANVAGLMRESEQRQRMGERARRLARPKATAAIVNELLAMVTSTNNICAR